MSRIPLRVSIPLLLTAPVLLVAGVLSATFHLQGASAARDITRRTIEQSQQRIHTHLDAMLSAPGKINAINKSLVLTQRLPLDDLAAWRSTFQAQLAAEPKISSVVFGAPDGRATWVCRYVGDDQYVYYAINLPDDPGTLAEFRIDANGRLGATPSSVFPYDARTRPWHQAALQAGGPAWCEPFVFVGGSDAEVATLGVSYAEPLYDDDGALLGVIDADLSLNDISHYLARLSIAGGVYIVDRDGLLIGSSLEAHLIDAEGRRVAAADSTHAAIHTSARHVAATISSPSAAGPPYEKTLDIEGEPVLCSVSAYEHATGVEWIVVSLTPEASFLGNINAARRQGMWVAVGATLLTLILGFAAAAWIVRPIVQLGAHVRAIGAGDLEREVDLRQSPELRRLSSQINSMTADLRDRMRLRQSLAVAMDVQQALLPDDSPQVTGLDIAGHSNYCDETGGDYYDFLDVSGLGDRSVCVALGDVMGHGVAAAMLMATARGILRSSSQQDPSLAGLLTHLNRLLVADTGGKRFMTMLLMTLDPANHELRWASAGHEPPFYYDPETNRYHELDGSGLPLGLFAEEIYEDHTFRDVRTGQVFFMATDGVWETLGPQGEQFGKQRIREILEQHHNESAEAISRRIHDALHRFRGDDSQDDDVTFVVVRVM